MQAIAAESRHAVLRRIRFFKLRNEVSAAKMTVDNPYTTTLIHLDEKIVRRSLKNTSAATRALASAIADIVNSKRKVFKPYPIICG